MLGSELGSTTSSGKTALGRLRWAVSLLGPDSLRMGCGTETACIMLERGSCWGCAVLRGRYERARGTWCGGEANRSARSPEP